MLKGREAILPGGGEADISHSSVNGFVESETCYRYICPQLENMVGKTLRRRKKTVIVV